MLILKAIVPITLLVSSADTFCKQFGAQIRPDKGSSVIWIQTV